MRSVALISFLILTVQLAHSTENPVYRYIDNQDIDSLEIYLDKHDINAELKDSNTTLLVYAILQENAPSCQFLIEKGADINTEDKIRCTPLAIATVREQKDVAELLHKHGAGMKESDNTTSARSA